MKVIRTLVMVFVNFYQKLILVTKKKYVDLHEILTSFEELQKV